MLALLVDVIMLLVDVTKSAMYLILHGALVSKVVEGLLSTSRPVELANPSEIFFAFVDVQVLGHLSHTFANQGLIHLSYWKQVALDWNSWSIKVW